MTTTERPQHFTDASNFGAIIALTLSPTAGLLIAPHGAALWHRDDAGCLDDHLGDATRWLAGRGLAVAADPLRASDLPAGERLPRGATTYVAVTAAELPSAARLLPDVPIAPAYTLDLDESGYGTLSLRQGWRPADLRAAREALPWGCQIDASVGWNCETEYDVLRLIPG